MATTPTYIDISRFLGGIYPWFRLISSTYQTNTVILGGKTLPYHTNHSTYQPKTSLSGGKYLPHSGNTSTYFNNSTPWGQFLKSPTLQKSFIYYVAFETCKKHPHRIPMRMNNYYILFNNPGLFNNCSNLT